MFLGIRGKMAEMMNIGYFVAVVVWYTLMVIIQAFFSSFFFCHGNRKALSLNESASEQATSRETRHRILLFRWLYCNSSAWNKIQKELRKNTDTWKILQEFQIMRRMNIIMSLVRQILQTAPIFNIKCLGWEWHGSRVQNLQDENSAEFSKSS